MLKLAHHDGHGQEQSAPAAYAQGGAGPGRSDPNAAGLVFMGLVAVLAVAIIAGAIAYNYRAVRSKHSRKQEDI